ncbi:hypothetical protein BJ166DRAFT_143681 [Pestalotiopsis sp. NC0098]|nr:hypothetical protein BJ166DRAFT_143681 [Pestalotiopsis sp. NC0098]
MAVTFEKYKIVLGIIVCIHLLADRARTFAVSSLAAPGGGILLFCCWLSISVDSLGGYDLYITRETIQITSQIDDHVQHITPMFTPMYPFTLHGNHSHEEQLPFTHH